MGATDLRCRVEAFSKVRADKWLTASELGNMMYCRPVINKPPPFKGLDITIPIIIPIKDGGFINKGSTVR